MECNVREGSGGGIGDSEVVVVVMVEEVSPCGIAKNGYNCGGDGSGGEMVY